MPSTSELVIFFSNDTATTEIYTLSLHDALPISGEASANPSRTPARPKNFPNERRDRKSTRLNSSHPSISYAVFCLKKKTLIQLSHRVIIGHVVERISRDQRLSHPHIPVGFADKR